MAELRGVVAEHGLGTPEPHAFVPEPADQPVELTVTLEGVTAQVTGREVPGSIIYFLFTEASLFMHKNAANKPEKHFWRSPEQKEHPDQVTDGERPTRDERTGLGSSCC